jgi:hypothetical protein
MLAANAFTVDDEGGSVDQLSGVGENPEASHNEELAEHKSGNLMVCEYQRPSPYAQTHNP